MSKKKPGRQPEPTTIAELVPDPANRRVHNPRNIGMVVDALQHVGAARSIVIDEHSTILAGNGVTEAAAQAGITRVRVIDTAGDEIIAVRRSGLTDEQKRALAIYDNRTAELATWNFEQLADDRAHGLSLQPFWTPEEEAALLDRGAGTAGRTDPDDVPAARETTIARGDLFQLGRHRLICGDSTHAPDVERLAGDERVDLVFTSPPYAEQRKEQYGGIAADEYVTWFRKVESAIGSVISPRGHFVLNIKPHAAAQERNLYVLDLVSWLVRSAGWLFVDEFVWLRTGIPQQVVNRFKNAFEPVYWFAKSADYLWFPEVVRHPSDSVPLPLGPGGGNTSAARFQGKGGGAVPTNAIVPGLAYPSNVLDFKQNAPAIGHPAAYPVQLPSFFVQCMTAPAGLVFDPFVGSGTTIIACEQFDRSCRAIEIDPSYCQIAINRWEQFTGQTAVAL